MLKFGFSFYLTPSLISSSVVLGALTRQFKEARDRSPAGDGRSKECLLMRQLIINPFRKQWEWNIAVFNLLWFLLQLQFDRIVFVCIFKLINYNPVFSKYHWWWVVNFSPKYLSLSYFYDIQQYIAEENVVQTVPFPELFMKSIKTPNHPAYHWSTLWPLEVWTRTVQFLVILRA